MTLPRYDVEERLVYTEQKHMFRDVTWDGRLLATISLVHVKVEIAAISGQPHLGVASVTPLEYVKLVEDHIQLCASYFERTEEFGSASSIPLRRCLDIPWLSFKKSLHHLMIRFGFKKRRKYFLIFSMREESATSRAPDPTLSCPTRCVLQLRPVVFQKLVFCVVFTVSISTLPLVLYGFVRIEIRTC